MKHLALAATQAHLVQCRYSLCNPIVKSNSNVQTRPQQHRCFYLALLINVADRAKIRAELRSTSRQSQGPSTAIMQRESRAAGA